MALSPDQKLADDESHRIAGRLREELARRRMTRQGLAHHARISLSTLEKALSGKRPFTLATLVRLEEALGLELRPRAAAPAAPAVNGRIPGLAPEELGSYSRPAVAWIEGEYLTLRPSFSAPSAIYAYRTEIRWDEASSGLAFRESERLDADFTQHGLVSAPHQSGHIYLVTNRHGQYRLIIVSRPTINGEMHGVLTTLLAGRGSQLTPVATPIVLAPLASVGHAEFGRIDPGHTAFARYKKLLKRTIEEPFAFLLSG
ncbi:MAG: helix-turn-helix transcriptional regulator [Pseudomonadota bacterium]